MQFAQLQTEQSRFHEATRPRNMNPTFVSSNVGGSLGASIYRSQSMNNLTARPTNMTSSVMMPTKPSSPSMQNNSELNPNVNRSDIRSNRGSMGSRHQPQQMKSTSNLMSYGSSSLPPLRKYISDKEVYEKQQKKYNIVTIQPKGYEDTIKVFPKYRLENSDENYYKKLITENKMRSTKDLGESRRRFEMAIDKKLDINPEAHLTQLENNTEKHPQGAQTPKYEKPIRGKMLNNVDELKGIL